MPDAQTTDPTTERAVRADVDHVCLLVPPLWELDAFVAVNPFLGFTSTPIEATARTMAEALDAQVLPPMAHYRRLWAQGGFGAADLARAATACDADPLHLESILLGHSTVPMRQPEPVFTHAERIDREHGSHWEDLTRDAAAGLCERHFAKSAADHGPRPGLYACWLEDAAMDPSLEIEGLVGFRGWVRCLPRSPELAVVDMLDRLEVAPWDRRPYLYRLLAGVHGWASHLRRWAWTKDREDPGLVREVLAVRLCLDAAVAALAPVSANGRGACSAPLPVEDERVRMTLQDAVEDAWARRLARDLARTPITRTDRPAVQAILCIDVRSEPLRRHLEAHDEGVETAGFAGFFGMAVRWTGAGGAEDRCPVLLRPSVQLHAPEVTPDGHAGSLLASLTKWPGSTFPAVETLGLGAAATLLRRAVRAVKPRTRDEESLPLQGLLERVTSLEARIETAAGMLAGLGLGRRLARLVLLLGHQGRSENNPHAAGLDCGACGGHGGAINARLAAALLNDPEVRRGLADHGAGLPEDTRFVSGVHETCSDEVRLLDVDAVPASHAPELRRLREALDHACEATRRERATAMAIDPSAPGVRATLADRGGDWSQTRPEWALARNACFIAARRIRTMGLDLQGRAFLHEYDASLDGDDSVLSLILSAPMVVASWINLQYFASTVDNRVFGSGDKMLHNRVGTVGVVAGNGRDLRSGLPLQSVQSADGRWFHEPMRLQVFVEASTERIDRVLAAQPGVRDLIMNGWVRLFSLRPTGGSVARLVPGEGWERFHAEADHFQQREHGTSRPRSPRMDVPQQSRPRAAAAGEGSRDPAA